MSSFDAEFFTSEFAKENLMGPNALRIIDELVGNCRFPKGIRILDLGCGKGLTSMYLAEKFDATVFAVDLWVGATENHERFKSFSLEDRIIPIHAEAHDLPFADEYFDVVTSVGAYDFFACEEEYLSKHLKPIVKKSGKIFIGMAGLQNEFTDGVPEELKPFWQEGINFHTCAWWRELWSRESEVVIDACVELKCLREAWADWLTCDNFYAKRDIGMMAAEAGKYFSLVGIEATRL